MRVRGNIHQYSVRLLTITNDVPCLLFQPGEERLILLSEPLLLLFLLFRAHLCVQQSVSKS